MSEVDFSGLDELFDYKNQLMSDLLTNEKILLLLDDEYANVVTPEYLMYKQVFPFEYLPDTIEHGQTFICSEVDIERVPNKTFLIPALYIWVFTHKSKLRLPDGGGVRTDRIVSEVVKILNGSRVYGLGTLEFERARRFLPVPDYQGRMLTFLTKDYNRLSPNSFPVPANRKRGL